LEGRILRFPLDKGNKLKEGWTVSFFGERLENKGREGIFKRELVPMCERRVSYYV